jgi:hypothetical protein
MKFPIGAMSVGDILDRGLKLLLARFPLLISITLLVQLPFMLFQLLIPLLEGAGVGLVFLTLLATLLSVLILAPLSQAVILYVVMREYVDRPATMAEAFSLAMSRFGPLLGTVFLSGLLIGLGFLACFIPGAYLAIMWAFAAQVVVLENRSGMDALQRSKALVTGHGWRVFGVVFLIQIVAGFVGGLIGGTMAVVLPYQEAIPGPRGFPVMHFTSYPNYVIAHSFELIVNVLIGSYLAVCMTLLYLDLRIRKEGFDLEIEAQKEGPAPA